MADDDYQLLRVRRDGGVVFATIDNPPVNLMDFALVDELGRLAETVAHDDACRVVVFDSADPEFFIAHFDVEAIRQLPAEPAPRPQRLNPIQAVFERYRTMPKVSIAKLAGRARGGGSEFLLSLDMRFAARGSAVLGQPEVGLGIIPGAGGTQRLPRLMGRSRALEVVLGCADFDADLAERYGYVNRALPAGELDPFVDQLAHRIASFPPEALRLAKESVLSAGDETAENLLDEADRFNRAAASDAARERMARFMAAGGQTRDAERDLDVRRSSGDD